MSRRKGTKNRMGLAYATRQKESTKLMVGVGLWAHLHNLVDEILAGNANKLSEFQEYVQYAPTKMRIELLDKLEVRKV